MTLHTTIPSLVGIGLYTPSEAGRLLKLAPGKIVRWLRGHTANGRTYERLWAPQIEDDEVGVVLGFRDLMEVRVAAAFIDRGLSAQKVREAISIARAITGDDHPLSTTGFKTDGRTIFLEVLGSDGEQTLINLFNQQYAFRAVIEQSLLNVDFGEAGTPERWWPQGRAKDILVDPGRAFGQPIDAASSVPTAVLARAAEVEGTVEETARVWGVSTKAVRRAIAFEAQLASWQAA